MHKLKVFVGAVVALSFLICGKAAASDDPVKADPNTGASFNRYSYANNNPYKFTDPDGRAVRYVYGGSVTKESGKEYMLGMTLFSPTARGEMRQIEKSGEIYTVVIDDRTTNGYDIESRTALINPKTTFTIESSGETQSATVNGAHEITHAAEHDRIGDEQFQKNLMQPQTKAGLGVSPEEQRATEVEKEVGKDLRQPTRENYDDVKQTR